MSIPLATNVPVEVYHNLIEAVHEDIGILHRYMRLRKKLMKTDELHMYDLYTSLVADADVKIPFEKAKEEVLDATAVLGKEYGEVLKHGFESRWIDVYHILIYEIILVYQRKRDAATKCNIPLIFPLCPDRFQGFYTLISAFTPRISLFFSSSGRITFLR